MNPIPVRDVPAIRAGLRAAALAAIGLLAACSQPAREARMTVADPPAPAAAPRAPLHQAVAVGEVVGGRPTSPLWLSQVDNPAFATALGRSLQASAMLALDDPAPRYLVSAQLLELRQPWFFIDPTVTSRVAYRVVDRASGMIVHEDEVTSASTVKIESEILGPERLRQASEGAIRENIRLFLERFAEHRPPSGEVPRPLAATR